MRKAIKIFLLILILIFSSSQATEFTVAEPVTDPFIDVEDNGDGWIRADGTDYIGIWWGAPGAPFEIVYVEVYADGEHTWTAGESTHYSHFFPLPLMSEIFGASNEVHIWYGDKAKGYKILSFTLPKPSSEFPVYGFPGMPQIEYVIIVPSAWRDAVEPLAEWKTRKGVPTYIATVEQIEADYSGRDLPWKIRTFIKEIYDTCRIHYVLLAGDVQYIPTRYIHNPDISEGGFPPFFSDDTYKPTDWYYACLDGTWDDDNDGIYGENSTYSITDEMDWYPEVAIGRLPANSYDELQTMVNKILFYEKNPQREVLEWFTTAILCGAPVKLDDDYFEDFGVMENEEIREFLPSQTDTLKFYHNTEINNISRIELVESINEGAFMINVASHGSPRAFYDTEWWNWILPDSFFGTPDVPTLSNHGKPSLVFASSCLTAAFDVETEGATWYRIFYKTSLAEELVKHPTGGAIAYVGWSRVTYTDFSTGNLFWDNFFSPETGNFRPGLSLLYAKRGFTAEGASGRDRQYLRKEYSSWHLLGDPEIPIWTNAPQVIPQPHSTNIFVGKTILLGTVPNATICLFNEEGTFYEVLKTDNDGKASFIAPNFETKISAVITAHNYIPIELDDHFSVKNYVIIDQTVVSRNRCDVGSSQTVSFHAKWALDNSDVVGGIIYINETGHITDGTGWTGFNIGFDTVEKYSWVITGVLCQGRTGYEEIVDNPSIIWDRVNITLSVSDNRINVGENASISWSGFYEYDGAVFNGGIYLNDLTTQNSGGTYSYIVQSISDPLNGLTVFTSNSIDVIFKKISTSISCSVSQSDLIIGDYVTVSGSIAPAVSDKTVTVTYTKPDDSTFTRICGTGLEGDYLDMIGWLDSPDVLGSWSVVASWAGDSTYEGASSPVYLFNVTKISSTLHCTVSSSEITKGDSITIYVLFHPEASSKTITLTYNKPDGSTFTRTGTTDPDGFYTDSYTPDADGSWSVIASWDGDSTHEGASSSEVHFTVNSSFIGGPGWIDDIAVFGGIGLIVIASLILILRKVKH